MKYWGRSLIVYLAIVTLLYGTKEVWAISNYNRKVTGAPGHSTFGFEPDPASYKRAETPIPGMGGMAFGKGGSGY